jgi:hypothetical protein
MRNVRIPIVSTLLIALVGCAGPNTSIPRDPVAYAEAAISEGQWETGYLFLEDAFAGSDRFRMGRAQELLFQNPQLLEAAKKTFSPDSVAAALSIHGNAEGIALERRRLSVYHALAISADYQEAERTVNEAAAVVEANRARQRAAVLAEIERKRAREADLAVATRAARVVCHSKDDCQKAFALTQIFISEKADMKIQLATDTIVETYNATELLRVSLKAVKIPGAGSAAQIVLSGSCKDGGNEGAVATCTGKLVSIYRAYPEYMKGSMAPSAD